MKKIILSVYIFTLFFGYAIKLYGTPIDTGKTKQNEHLSSFNIGLGGGPTGFGFNLFLRYYYVGFEVGGTLGDFNRPTETSNDYTNWPNMTSLSPKQYDTGILYYGLLLGYPLTNKVAISITGGYFEHTWNKYQTTIDNDHILDNTVKKVGNGVYESGVYWGFNFEYNIDFLFSISLSYIHPTGGFINFGIRF